MDGFLLISDGSGNRLLHLFPVVTRFPTPRDGYLARLLLNIENKANPGIFRRQLLDVKTRGPPRRETILYLLLSFYPVDRFLFFSSLIQPFHLLGGNLRRFPRVHTHTPAAFKFLFTFWSIAPVTSVAENFPALVLVRYLFLEIFASLFGFVFTWQRRTQPNAAIPVCRLLPMFTLVILPRDSSNLICIHTSSSSYMCVCAPIKRQWTNTKRWKPIERSRLGFSFPIYIVEANTPLLPSLVSCLMTKRILFS